MNYEQWTMNDERWMMNNERNEKKLNAPISSLKTGTYLLNLF